MFPSADKNYGLGPGFTHTLGLGYVHAYIYSKGFDSKIYLSEKTSLPLCVKEILAYKPKIVGISVVDDNYARCLLLVHTLKKVKPSLILVLGGPTPSVNHRFILENNPLIDICVRGEGEEVFHKLLQALSAAGFRMRNADLTGLRGITYRDEDAIMVNEPANILIENKAIRHYLDRYPSPYLSCWLPAAEAVHSGIITARGCNQNCVFCNCSILYKRHVFTHSIDRVLEELSFVSRMSPQRAAHIFDDAFTLFPKRAEKICRGIIENNIRLRLTCLTRCDYLSESLLDLMKEAGFKTVSLSLESAVPRILRVIGKNHLPEDIPSDGLEKEVHFINHIKTMAAYAKKIGMNVMVSIMLGLPTETHAEAARTIRYLDELAFDQYNHNFFTIPEGTPISSNYRRYGYRLERVSKNQIKPETIRPLDLSGIGRSRNSMQEGIFRHNEKEQFHILGLSTKREMRERFFDNVIVRSDLIQENVVRWLQENLALGGGIVQIFSGSEEFKENRRCNMKMLLDHFSPSTKLSCYYMNRDGKENNKILTRGKNVFCEEIPLRVLGTKTALGKFQGENGSGVHTLALDLEREDGESLIDLLKTFDGVNPCLDHLMNAKPYPLFTGLCRWTRTAANCRKLETAIIDEKDQIKLCWGGDPVGTIPDSLEVIIESLKASTSELMKKRGCSCCHAEANCIKCYFPGPLPVEEYCRYMKSTSIWEQAEAFRNYYTFSDYFGLIHREEI